MSGRVQVLSGRAGRHLFLVFEHIYQKLSFSTPSPNMERNEGKPGVRAHMHGTATGVAEEYTLVTIAGAEGSSQTI